MGLLIGVGLLINAQFPSTSGSGFGGPSIAHDDEEEESRQHPSDTRHGIFLCEDRKATRKRHASDGIYFICHRIETQGHRASGVASAPRVFATFLLGALTQPRSPYANATPLALMAPLKIGAFGDRLEQATELGAIRP